MNLVGYVPTSVNSGAGEPALGVPSDEEEAFPVALDVEGWTKNATTIAWPHPSSPPAVVATPVSVNRALPLSLGLVGL